MGSFPHRPASPAVISLDHVHTNPFLLQFLLLLLLLLVSLPFKSANLVVVGSRPVQAQSGVGVELADDAVAGGAEGDGQDEADGEQLDGDFLEGTDALGDGVGCVEEDC